MSYKRIALLNVIRSDLWRRNKFVSGLILMILLSALLTVSIAHYSRALTTQLDELVFEQSVLDSAWRYLILEEKTLTTQNKIERFARQKLNMQHITPQQEIVVINKEDKKN